MKQIIIIVFFFQHIISSSQTIEKNDIVNDSIEIYYNNYNSKWLTIGTNYDVINTIYNIDLSNGLDEFPIFHFEDLTTDYLYKFSAQTDFRNDYSLSTNLKWKHPFKKLNAISLECSKKNFESIQFYNKDISLTTEIYLRFLKIVVKPKVAYQELNQEKNVGFELGLQKTHFKKGIYYGFSTGNYNDYWNYKLYLQKFLIRYKLSSRIVFERINKNDFFKIGINYTFNR
jgi:hypothetical protein